MTYRCPTMRGHKTMSEEAWRREHRACGGAPERSYQKAQPRAYKIYTLTCSCGASFRGIEELPKDGAR